MNTEKTTGLRVRTGLTAGETITVYGSSGCSWTRKQLETLKQKGLPYTFVDCDTQDCPDFVEAFPTVVTGGDVYLGFKQM